MSTSFCMLVPFPIGEERPTEDATGLGTMSHTIYLAGVEMSRRQQCVPEFEAGLGTPDERLDGTTPA